MIQLIGFKKGMMVKKICGAKKSNRKTAENVIILLAKIVSEINNLVKPKEWEDFLSFKIILLFLCTCVFSGGYSMLMFKSFGLRNFSIIPYIVFKITYLLLPLPNCGKVPSQF